LTVGALRVFEIGPDKVVAHDEADAWAVWCAHTGESRDDYEGEEARELPGDEPIRILVDEKGRISDSGALVIMRAEKWAAQEGRGFLCSSEY